ncbi:methyltransferase domain-containing protein [Solilutibacter silvestris]|uniref:Methyltransferase domain-containing protein n=1 Tax=Solilutibacter silvestris TaxID=1645665 RepID=A0A2K1Q2D4_9GAMM|nr:methyltransferase domain-containing protein [Lysobacter silvestris]PNS09206.1 Methyltransferase domain-containing protein [Lysobacter silvestris]
MREKNASEIVSEVRRRLSPAGLSEDRPDGGSIGWWSGVNPTIEYKESYAVGDFLRYSDSVLVEAAYRCILKRPPDPDGLAHHVGKLRAGEIDVVDLLAGFRWSPEGEVHRVHIDGLLLPTKLRQWSKLPLIGRVIRWGHGLYRVGSVDRRVNARAARQAYEFKELGDHLNRLAAGVLSQFAAITERAELREGRANQALHDIEEAVAGGLRAAEQRIQGTNDEAIGLKSRMMDFEQGLARERKAAGVLADGLKSRMMDFEQGLAREHNATGVLADELRKLEGRALQLDSGITALSSHHHVFEQELARFNQLAVEAQRARAIIESHERELEIAREAERRLDSLYVNFESQFRGDSALLRVRMLPYIDILREAGILESGLPVLDVACGNGEWLEILRENGIAACGVDSNKTFVELCNAKGLDVHAMDALGFLRGQPESVYSAVTSMHLVEHLALIDLVALLDEAHRTLQPGGLLILETPNPENFAVSSIDFYNDPTHRNPIPPNTLKWMVEARGFTQARIERLTAGRDWGAPDLLDPALPGANSINQLLNRARAAPDYAVIGVKV